MKWLLTISLIMSLTVCLAQQRGRLVLKGEYTTQDSIEMVGAYERAKQAVSLMHKAMNSICTTEEKLWNGKKARQKEQWDQNETFVEWLGPAEKISMVRRKINRIHSKFNRKLILVSTREDVGKCNRWTGAWAVPFGRVRIRLCENFFNSKHLQEKILIHELGHEAGMLFHRGIHNCWAARRASTFPNNVAKRSTENYAWLAVSYMGIHCTH